MKKVLVVLAVLFLSQCVFAHDGILGTFDLYNLDLVYGNNHQDAAGWKGWATLTVTNYTGVDWTDFHFQINDAGGLGGDISTVDYRDASMGGNDPIVQGHTLDNWVIDNVTVGATLDLYFAGDPVVPNETVTIQVWTDNTTAQAPWFGQCFYPTPEPATLLLLGVGGLLIRRRK